jgi:EAL domain-containing protein (putative c-di-GMP-specific phosphodiesterase class I)
MIPKKTGMTAVRKTGVANLLVFVQPIYDVTRKEPALHALECLIRGPKGSDLETPAALFELVKTYKSEARFDIACLELQIEKVSPLPGEPRISLNIHAATLCADPGFPRFLDHLAWGSAVSPTRLTLEIADYGRFAEDPALSAAVRELKALGIKIALDDSGLGDPDFRLLLDLKPTYLKVDRYLVRGLVTEESNRAILAGLVSLSKTLGFRIVAEGVETAEELRIVTDMGIGLVQGFLLGEPVPPEVFRTGALLGKKNPWDGSRPI